MAVIQTTLHLALIKAWLVSLTVIGHKALSPLYIIDNIAGSARGILGAGMKCSSNYCVVMGNGLRRVRYVFDVLRQEVSYLGMFPLLPSALHSLYCSATFSVLVNVVN